MPFSYRLRPGLHWTLCGGRPVFLDFAGDRYFCLGPMLEEAFLRFLSGDLTADDLGLQPIVARGLFVREEADAATDPVVPVAPATGDYLDEPRRPTRPLDLLAAMWWQMRWAFRLRTKSLEAIAAGIESGSCRAGRTPADAHRRIARLAASFAASALVLRAADRCLVRALAFQDLCVRSGIYPRLVFGVRANLFRAHAWVQLEDKVLIGDYEQVRLFTPIAALG